MSRPNTTEPGPPGWSEILQESDADLKAGRVVPLASIEAELRDAINDIEAKLAGGHGEAARNS